MSETCHDCGQQLDSVPVGQQCPSCGSIGRDQTIRVPTIEARATALPVTVWLTYHFAPEWLADARRESGLVNDHNARRREVVFSVCFAESYLFEFVRDGILGTNFQRVSEFFPPGERLGIRDRWKEVLRRLLKAGLIAEMPKGGDLHDEEWNKLVEYRDGLVHARSSRPQTHPQPEAEEPLPSKSTLDTLAPGWAVRVVVERARRLHEAAGTAVPEWLVA